MSPDTFDVQKVKADFEEVAKVEYAPRMEGRQMIMILAPRCSRSPAFSKPRSRDRGFLLCNSRLCN